MGTLKPKVSAATFSATCQLDARVLSAELSGTADMVVRAPLDEFLMQLQEEAERFHVKEVLIDFRKLEFMNSSCFKSFVTWINSVQEAPADRRYRIRLRSSPAMLWQRRSMHALKSFATDVVDLES